jgi:Mrp family chromosome partitioning ATPase
LNEWPASSLVFAGAASSTELPEDRAAAAREPEAAESIESWENPEVTDDSPHSAVAPADQPWKAQWEVDEFSWPEELARLQNEQTEYFRYAGDKLRDASREGLRTLAVFATREQEGCTTMAICLAMAAAAAGTRVALLDANLQHPQLGDKLGLDFSQGWQQSLTANGSLAESAVVALDSNLTLLPLSADHQLPTAADPRVTHAIRRTAAAFDLLVIDAGVVPDRDGLLFAGGTECPINAALVVRDLRRTSEAETVATARRLKLLGIEAIGIAENFLPPADNQVAAA